jgi:glycosyltransferase involved in cell wall biosynthesis
MRRPSLLFVVTDDWYFCSHRMDLARFARDEGFEVLVGTHVAEHGDHIRDAGVQLWPLQTLRRGAPDLRDIAAATEMLGLYARVRPDIVHHVALKPVVYGSWAAALTRVPRVVNAIAGLGSSLIAGGPGGGARRAAVAALVRLALARPGVTTIFQNAEDRDYFTGVGRLRPARAVLIRGAGVDTRVFVPSPEPPGPPVVMLPARMLADKGVADFVEAARILSAWRVRGRFALVGGVDPRNPSGIPEHRLRRWQEEGLVEWWGHRADMPAALAAATIVVLPSYREGLPKVLVEAAATGRAIVTTDVPGCRDVVRQGVNGWLVPPRDPPALASAIAGALHDPAWRAAAGRRGRDIAEREFSAARIARETVELYRRLLDPARGDAATSGIPVARA